MAALTERQQKDLHVALLEYLLGQGASFSATVKAFRGEANLPSETDSGKQLLERKWTSVVRLQKRVMDLESKVAEMEQALRNSSSGSGGGSGNGSANGGVLTFVRDGAGGGGDNRMIPRAPAKATMTGHRAPVMAIAVHPVYSLAATGSEDNCIKLWDFDTAQYERTLKGHTGHVTGVAFDHVGNMLASCSADMCAKLWDLSTYACTKTLRGHDHTLSCVLFTPSGDAVLTASRDQSIKVWEVSTGYCTRTLSGHAEWARCLSVSLNGDMLASGGSDHNILVWKLSTGALLATLRGHEHVVESVSYGRRPLSAADIIAAETKASAGSSSGNSSSGSSSGSAGTDGGAGDASFDYLASGSRDRTVKLWSALAGQCLMTFAVHENWVRCVLFHPSGKFILSCSDDKSIRVMDIKVRGDKCPSPPQIKPLVLTDFLPSSSYFL